MDLIYNNGQNPPFNNRGLFADHFLKDAQRLKALDEWRNAGRLDTVLQQVAQAYRSARARFSDRTNESQTEHDLIQPVLDLLWGRECYQVQVVIPSPTMRRQPDYGFFRTPEDRSRASSIIGAEAFWRDVVCLGDAKRWAASLDKERGSDENPTAQICNYLYRARVRWGILTNGRVWRLYEREKSSAGGIYYEVDLDDVIDRGERGDLEAFKYFLLFFRREAFVPGQDGRSFVEKVFQGSADYAAEVGERLKDSVYDALRLLMDGFLERPANKLDAFDPKTLALVHENALIALYRLLFLFYAEDRGLLPKNDNSPYAAYGLYRIQREVYERLRSGKVHYLPEGRRLWCALTNLFTLIGEGSPKGKIPAYNGGLFNRAKYPLISHAGRGNGNGWEIGDDRLATVIDLLAYEREQWDRPGGRDRDIDYNSLDVQHLGTIYEGLLELQPRVAIEPTVETIADGRTVFKPVHPNEKPRPIQGRAPRLIQPGEVYLVTNRGERKASGSYYTPKYIVDYIVRNTLGPLVEDAAREVAASRPETDARITELETKLKEWEQTSGDPEARALQCRKLKDRIERHKRRLFEPYLALKICDPSMGSGHFLVGAADFLSLAMAADPNLPTLEAFGGEPPQDWYKRLVVERCLYGVDLNPLAVELAKLSLWLHMVSRDKALSFLDHHLRCGNSLVGARFDDLTVLPEIRRGGKPKAENPVQPSLLNMNGLIQEAGLMVGSLALIAELPSDTADDIREKQGILEKLDAERRDKWRRIADLWISAWFEADLDARESEFEELEKTLAEQHHLFDQAEQIHVPDRKTRKLSVNSRAYQLLVEAIRKGTEREVSAALRPLLVEAEKLAGEKRFFHWELEFPEVFFDRTGPKSEENRGFDAVIGNPPWGARISKVDQTYFNFKYASAAADSFALLTEQALNLIRRSKFLGYIIPSGWQSGKSFSTFRRFLIDVSRFRRIVNLPYDVFRDAYVDSTIVINDLVANVSQADTFDVRILTFDRRERVEKIDDEDGRWYEIDYREWFKPEADPLGDRVVLSLLRSEGLQIVKKMIQASRPLREVADVQRGITPFHLASRKADETWFPALDGELRRYTYEYSGKFHVKYDESIEEFQPLRYFQGRRILLRELISRKFRLQCALTDEFFVTNKSHQSVLLTDDRLSLAYLLSLLNSKLSAFYHIGRSTIALRDDFPKIVLDETRNLPIRRIPFDLTSAERSQIFSRGERLYVAGIARRETADILRFVEEQLAATPGRADVVHDVLAYLAEQMISMNKEKQAETKGFLVWLERTLGAKIETFDKKTELRNYHEADFAAFLTVLRGNRRKFMKGADPDARVLQGTLSAEFEASTAKLTPLKQRIADTDALIDQIVYRLYGLTEAEIAVVETGVVQS